MKFVSRIGLVAALAFAAGTWAEESNSTDEARQVIARADTGARKDGVEIVTAIALDRFAGRYDAPSGAMFVSREGDTLVLEVSDTATRTTLVRLDARTFASADDSVIVSFKTDESGRVNGLVVSATSSDSTLTAARAAPRRGIVTIHDVREAIARL
jgi:hypothetical protein